MIFHNILRASRGLPQLCPATIRRDLLLELLNPYHIMSAVTALEAAAQLEVACPIFCVLRDEHLSIDRPVHFSPGLLVLACLLYTSPSPRDS